PHLVFPAPLYLYSSGIIVNGNSLGGRLGAAPSFACEMDVLFSVRCCLNVGIVCIEVSPSSPHYPVSVMWCGVIFVPDPCLGVRGPSCFLPRQPDALHAEILLCIYAPHTFA